MKIKNIIGFTCASVLLLGSVSLGVITSNKDKVYTPTFATYANHDASTYYSTIDTTKNGNELLTQLQDLNSKKRQSTVGYSSMGTSPSGQFKYTDYDPNTVKYDSNGQPYGTKISSFYTYTSATSWNREHVWPNSHGGGSKGSLTGTTVDADIHMPRPTITEENSSRGNSFFVEDMNSSSNGWDPKTAGYDEKSRGEAARIILYCVVADSRLELVASNRTSTPDNKMGNIETILKWNMDYEVTDREKNRNEGAEYLQGNRNPFIDHREWGCRIWGKTNEKTKQICAGYLDDGPKVDVTGVSLNKTSAEVSVGAKTTLTATVSPNNATINTVKWTSSDTSIATVSDGVVTGVKEGTATITATTVDGGFKATCQVTVTAAVTVKVTFNTDGGSEIAQQTVISGYTVIKPENPTKTGFTFTGWYLQGESNPFDFNTPITSNITLVAHWQANSTDNHGLLEGDPLTPAEAIALCDKAGSGKIVGTDKQYYVKGVFDKGTTVNSQYHQWYGNLSGTVFKVSGATNDSGVNVKEVDGGMDGREIVVKGFIELYEGVYKIGYLPATASPTGSKFVPSIITVSGGSDTPDIPDTPDTPDTPVDPGTNPVDPGTDTPDTPDTPVVSKKLTSIQVTPPTKTEYNVGEKLDLTGFKVVAKYSDGSTKEVENKDISFSQYDMSFAGEKLIRVYYAEGDEVVNSYFKITVIEKTTERQSAGCGGSIIASSAIVSLTSLMGLGLFFKKNKQK